MKNFMLLPASRADHINVVPDDEDDTEELKETNSDCEHGIV